jgi:hypothetical protein
MNTKEDIELAIAKLEAEWDRLDSQGDIVRQSEILEDIEVLKKQLEGLSQVKD